MILKQTFVQHEEAQLDYYHLENPTQTPWSTIADRISKHKGASLQQIPLKQWIAKVREHGLEGAEKVPAIRLVEFFENMQSTPGMDISNTLTIAPEVDHGTVSPDLIERYLDYQNL